MSTNDEKVVKKKKVEYLMNRIHEILIEATE
jgi:hypothetical protein